MTFKFTVHDVGHGQLLTLETPDSGLLMWDCGEGNNNSATSACQQLGRGVVRELTITNFDQDHVSNLPALRASCEVQTLYRNRSISPEQLRRLKREGGPISTAMESTIQMHEAYTGEVTREEFPEISGLEIFRAYNDYPDQADDTNNLSVLSIIKMNGLKIVVSGDLEKKGWDTLLQRSDVREQLRWTNIFVASHHGRESGYNEEVMKIASPDVVVMSDYEVQHDTQKTQTLYGQHCSGIEFEGVPRKVLTTRSDGTFWWTA